MTARRPKPRRVARKRSERGPGRPALGDAKRSRNIQIRVTPAFEAKIVIAARAAGMSVSDWGLGVLVTALRAPRRPDRSMTIEFLVYDADLIASTLHSKADWLRHDSRPGCHDPEDCAKLQAAADRIDAVADTIDARLAAMDDIPAPTA